MSFPPDLPPPPSTSDTAATNLCGSGCTFVYHSVVPPTHCPKCGRCLGCGGGSYPAPWSPWPVYPYPWPYTDHPFPHYIQPLPTITCGHTSVSPGHTSVSPS